jgi:hypothetical protein
MATFPSTHVSADSLVVLVKYGLGTSAIKHFGACNGMDGKLVHDTSVYMLTPSQSALLHI